MLKTYLLFQKRKGEREKKKLKPKSHIPITIRNYLINMNAMLMFIYRNYSNQNKDKNISE